jgi:ribosomal protein S12 methylthiotransferase accessory factor
MGHLLDIETITCPLIKVLLEKFKKANIDVIIFDLSCNAPLPTYYVSVLSNDARGLDIACAGQATHIVPEIALRRALLEAAQSRSVAIQGSREDLIRHDTHWTGSFEYYQQKRQEMKDYIRSKYGFSSMPIPTSINSLFELVTVTLDHLYHNAYKNIIVTDLTEVNVNIPVTHVIIPGMRDTIIEPKRNEHQLNLIESVLTET